MPNKVGCSLSGLEDRISLLEKTLLQGLSSKAQIISSIFDNDGQQDGVGGKPSDHAPNSKSNPCAKLWGGPIMPASDQNLW
jgi:hypothetical protein